MPGPILCMYNGCGRKVAMAAKELAKNVIDALPEDSTLDEIIHAL